jgi:hypothetical protein
LYCASGNVVTIVKLLRASSMLALPLAAQPIRCRQIAFRFPVESAGLRIMRSYTSAYRNGIVPQHRTLFRLLDGSDLHFWIWRADRLSLFAF